MEYLLFYSIFALATGFTALYELYLPVLRDVEILNKESPVIQSKAIGVSTFFLACVLLAPIVIGMCLVPSWGERARGSLTDTFAA